MITPDQRELQHVGASQAPTQLELPAGTLVVLAGLTGAGKTTLLRRLDGTPGVRAVDSEDVAAWVGRVPVPYRWLRPLVHTLHLLRLALIVHGRAAVVLTTDPCTSLLRRRLLARIARAARRGLHVTWVVATVDEARDGRDQRGRHVPAARVARHERAYQSDHSRITEDRRLSRGAAAFASAHVVPVTPGTTAGAGRHRPPPGAAPTHAWPHAPGATPSRHKEFLMFLASFRNRTAVGIASVATMLGLWFGLTAPAVSPVFGGPPGVATTVQQVAVLDQNANAAGGTDDDGSFGGGARGGANGGRR